MSFSGSAAIVGLGATDYTLYSGKSGTSLAAEAIARALDDAGLVPSDVDGINHYVTDGSTSAAELVATLGIPNMAYNSAAGWGGAAGPAILGHAAAAIASGLASTVVCYRSQPNGPDGLAAPGSAGPPGRNRVLGGEFLAPFGFGNEHNCNALHIQRHMSLYGTTAEQLGEIAVTLRHHASLNPKALIRKPIHPRRLPRLALRDRASARPRHQRVAPHRRCGGGGRYQRRAGPRPPRRGGVHPGREPGHGAGAAGLLWAARPDPLLSRLRRSQGVRAGGPVARGRRRRRALRPQYRAGGCCSSRTTASARRARAGPTPPRERFGWAAASPSPPTAAPIRRATCSRLGTWSSPSSSFGARRESARSRARM